MTRSPNTPVIELVRPRGAGVEIFRVRSTAPYPTHVAQEYRIALVLAGAKRFDHRRASWIAPRGAVMMAAPGEAHAGRPVGARLDVLMVCVAAERLAHAPDFRPSIVADDELAGRVATLAHVARAEGDGLAVDHSVAALLDLWVARYGSLAAPPRAPRGREPAGVTRARELIHARLGEVVTLAELTRVSGLPRARLVRAFHQELGLPPHAYQLHARVDWARALLVGGLAPAVVAVATGFCDQSHLNRHFTRIVGLPPGRYRSATVESNSSS